MTITRQTIEDQVALVVEVFGGSVVDRHQVSPPHHARAGEARALMTAARLLLFGQLTLQELRGLGTMLTKVGAELARAGGRP